jgi:hypothetical protein
VLFFPGDGCTERIWVWISIRQGCTDTNICIVCQDDVFEIQITSSGDLKGFELGFEMKTKKT